MAGQLSSMVPRARPTNPTPSKVCDSEHRHLLKSGNDFLPPHLKPVGRSVTLLPIQHSLTSFHHYVGSSVVVFLHLRSQAILVAAIHEIVIHMGRFETFCVRRTSLSGMPWLYSVFAFRAIDSVKGDKVSIVRRW